MKNISTHLPSLRPVACPSCYWQAGMQTVRKDRPLSGTTTE
jgi:hypothetical protein